MPIPKPAICRTAALGRRASAARPSRQTPRARPARSTRQSHQHQDRPDQGQQGSQHAGEELPGKREVVGLPDDQQGQRQSSGGEGERGRGARRAQVASQRAQRRNLGQLDQRRHGEAQERDQAGRDPDQDGGERRRREILAEPVREGRQQAGLTQPAEETAEQAGKEPEQDQAQHEDPHQQMSRRAQAAHHGHCVGLTLDQTMAGERDGGTRPPAGSPGSPGAGSGRRDRRRRRILAGRQGHRSGRC